MNKDKNVVSLEQHKHKVRSQTASANQNNNPTRIFDQLRSTIDDDLRQQMRDQMRKNHGIQ